MDKKTKVVDYLSKKTSGKCLFLFDHGLGDLIEFLSLYESVKTLFPKWQFKIGFHPSLNFHDVHEDTIPIYEQNNNYAIPINRSIVQLSNVLVRYDIPKLCKTYDFVFGIQFYDFNHPTGAPIKVPNPKIKNEMCKVLEFGLPENFNIIKYNILKTKATKLDKSVIFHFNGNTDKAAKTPNLDLQRTLWLELENNGFKPFDVHINKCVTIKNSVAPLPSFIPADRSFRDSRYAGYLDILNRISEAEFIVGICSGPMHMFCNVHGTDNAIGLEGGIKLNNYIKDFKQENIIRFDEEYINNTLINIIRGIK